MALSVLSMEEQHAIPVPLNTHARNARARMHKPFYLIDHFHHACHIQVVHFLFTILFVLKHKTHFTEIISCLLFVV